MKIFSIFFHKHRQFSGEIDSLLEELKSLLSEILKEVIDTGADMQLEARYPKPKGSAPVLPKLRKDYGKLKATAKKIMDKEAKANKVLLEYIGFAKAASIGDLLVVRSLINTFFHELGREMEYINKEMEKVREAILEAKKVNRSKGFIDSEIKGILGDYEKTEAILRESLTHTFFNIRKLEAYAGHYSKGIIYDEKKYS